MQGAGGRSGWAAASHAACVHETLACRGPPPASLITSELWLQMGLQVGRLEEESLSLWCVDSCWEIKESIPLNTLDKNYTGPDRLILWTPFFLANDPN